MSVSRRRFTQLASIAAGSVLTSLWVEAAHGPSPLGAEDCTDPAFFPGDINCIPEWVPKETNVVARRSALSVFNDPWAKDLFRGAVARFREKQAQWDDQAHVHSYMCTQGAGLGDLHEDGRFLFWHRAFLYFFERALRRQFDDRVRLNYWDWENAQSRDNPELYRAHPLDHDNRCFRMLTQADTDLSSTFMNGDIRLFMGVWSRSHPIPRRSTPISPMAAMGPHNLVHGAFKQPPGETCNEDMGHIELAAADPIFFAHHCNIDRMWEAWMRKYPKAREQMYPEDIPDQIFVRDEDGWKRLPLKCLWQTADLGYGYDNLMPTGDQPKSVSYFDMKKPSRGFEFVSTEKTTDPSPADPVFLMLVNVKLTGAALMATMRLAIFTKKVKAGATSSNKSYVGSFFPLSHRHGQSATVSAAIRARTNHPIRKRKGTLKLYIAPINDAGVTTVGSEQIEANSMRIVQ